MAIYHLSAKVVSRTSGRSAVAAAAYRSGERLLDARTGLAHDFRARSGVVTSFIVAPADAPEWALDRQSLWSATEVHETRSNSTTAREWEAALPDELDADQRAAAEAQIINFGQTPARLFTKPHPRRVPPLAPLPPIKHSPHAIRLASVVSPPLPGSGKLQRPHPERSLAPIAFLAVEGDASGALGTSRVVTMSADRSIGVHKFIRPPPGAAGGTRSALPLCSTTTPSHSSTLTLRTARNARGEAS